MSSVNYDESGYCLHLDLLTMLYLSRVSHTRRSGLVGKNKDVFKIYLPLKLRGLLNQQETCYNDHNQYVSTKVDKFINHKHN